MKILDGILERFYILTSIFAILTLISYMVDLYTLRIYLSATIITTCMTLITLIIKAALTVKK